MNVDSLSDDAPVPALGLRMRCERCGQRGADVRPNWNEERTSASHAIQCVSRCDPWRDACLWAEQNGSKYYSARVLGCLPTRPWPESPPDAEGQGHFVLTRRLSEWRLSDTAIGAGET